MTRQGRQPTALLGWGRIILRSIALLMLLLLGLLVFLVCHPFTSHNPAPRLFFAGAGRALGMKITTSGQRTRRGAFLLCNHVSWLDILALGGTTGTAFVAHDGLAVHGWLRWLCRLNDTVFIARHDRQSVTAQIEQVRQAIRETGALAIFPEGTTGWGREIMPFKSSLLSAVSPAPDGIFVQPVWLDYGSQCSEIAWVGDERGKDSYLRIASRRQTVCLTIHFLPPLTGEALADRKTIASAARDAILHRKLKSERIGDQRVAL